MGAVTRQTPYPTTVHENDDQRQNRTCSACLTTRRLSAGPLFLADGFVPKNKTTPALSTRVKEKKGVVGGGGGGGQGMGGGGGWEGGNVQ